MENVIARRWKDDWKIVKIARKNDVSIAFTYIMYVHLLDVRISLSREFAFKSRSDSRQPRLLPMTAAQAPSIRLPALSCLLFYPILLFASPRQVLHVWRWLLMCPRERYIHTQRTNQPTNVRTNATNKRTDRQPDRHEILYPASLSWFCIRYVYISWKTSTQLSHQPTLSLPATLH